jgi:tRNA(Ile2) C34 agmatinyltransferase TiaS
MADQYVPLKPPHPFGMPRTVGVEFYFYCPSCREEFDSDGELYRCPECLYSDYDDIDVGEEDDAGPGSDAPPVE